MFRWTGLVGAFCAFAAAFAGDIIGVSSPGLGPAQIAAFAFGVVLAVAALLPGERSLYVLLPLLSAAAALTFIELLLQVADPPRFRTTYQPDSAYLYKPIPGTTKTFRHWRANGGGTVTTHFNNSGFRGDDLTAGTNNLSVVVYGDSFIEAPFSPQDSTFPFQLGVALRTLLGQPVDVINAGVIGYGPDQIAVRMGQELPRLRPNLVVVSICAENDFGDLLRDKLFALDSSDEVRRLRPVLSDSLKELFEAARSGLVLPRVVRRFLLRRAEAGSVTAPVKANVPLARRLHAPAEDWLAKNEGEYQDYTRDHVVRNVFEDIYTADVSLLPHGESSLLRRRLMAGVLGEIERAARANGAAVLVMVIPSANDVLDEFEGGRIDSLAFPDYRRSSLNDAVANAAATRGLPVVDLFAHFRAASTRLYWHGDLHWNNEGQLHAARLVAEYIVGNDLLR